METIKVLVVDDSALIRRIISDILTADPRFTVVGTARDGIDALEKLTRLSPDLITLDVEMPRMDGLQTLKEIVRRFQKPVIMLSSLTQRGSRVTLEALALGAVDFIPKPERFYQESRETLAAELLLKASTVAQVKIRPVVPAPPQTPASAPVRGRVPEEAETAVVIGSSTGGPRALEAILTGLPHDLPATLLVAQHMPPNFTRAFAERLDKNCAIRVTEAQDGEPVLSGVAYVAPGNYHMEVDARKMIRLNQNPPVEHVRPSATVTMLSAARVYGKNTIGVVLTGMGKDGAAGMAEIKSKGGRTLVQDETTSVIFSMPKAVIQAGAADRILPLDEIAGAITAYCRGNA